MVLIDYSQKRVCRALQGGKLMRRLHVADAPGEEA